MNIEQEYRQAMSLLMEMLFQAGVSSSRIRPIAEQAHELYELGAKYQRYTISSTLKRDPAQR